MAVFVAFVISLSYMTFTLVKNIVADLPVNVTGGNLGDNPGQSGEGPDDALPGGFDEDAPIAITGRVTVLVMGIDERQSEQGPWRTDTMMVLTIDPTNNTAGMLSIPRDAWVEIPDYDGLYATINTAHFKGDADNYPGGGGPTLAMKTVRYNFGIPVNYYVTVNFNAFITLIDYLGCVPISVPETINDPFYPEADGPGYDPFYVEAGEHCMDAATLLKYARTRATYGGDFDRANRQQAVIRAIRAHILSTDQLTTLLRQSPQIYDELKDDIRTNLSLTQMIDLARLAARVPEENICSAVISAEYVDELVTLPDSRQVILLDRPKVRGLVHDIFTGTGRCTPGLQALQAQATAENATVSIINGTAREGLATQTKDRLAGLGVNVASVGNADRTDYQTTIIYVLTGKVNTAQLIARLLGLPDSAIVETSDPNIPYDIHIILGADYVP